MTSKDFYKNQAKNVRITPRKQMILQSIMPYLRPDLKVLDIGCGDGYIANCMNIFSKVTAFDRDVAVQKERFSRVKFLQGDFFCELPNEMFDIVVAFDVLEHLPNKEILIQELVKRSKKFIIVNQPDQEDKSQPYDKRVTPIEMITWMNSFGFKIVELKHFKFGKTESYNFMVFRKEDNYFSSWY